MAGRNPWARRLARAFDPYARTRRFANLVHELGDDQAKDRTELGILLATLRTTSEFISTIVATASELASSEIKLGAGRTSEPRPLKMELYGN
jgi:hypothetical protein